MSREIYGSYVGRISAPRPGEDGRTYVWINNQAASQPDSVRGLAQLVDDVDDVITKLTDMRNALIGRMNEKGSNE